MTPEDLQVNDPTPQRAWITSRHDIPPAVALVLDGAQRLVRGMHRDLSPFDLSAAAAVERIERFLLAHRSARVRLLLDDVSWLESDASRLKLLHRHFSHAIEMRVASEDDPVGDDGCLMADTQHLLLLAPSAQGIGDVWLNNEPHVQPWAATFDRRWEAAAHNLPVAPLGL